MGKKILEMPRHTGKKLRAPESHMERKARENGDGSRTGKASADQVHKAYPAGALGICWKAYENMNLSENKHIILGFKFKKRR